MYSSFTFPTVGREEKKRIATSCTVNTAKHISYLPGYSYRRRNLFFWRSAKK